MLSLDVTGFSTTIQYIVTWRMIVASTGQIQEFNDTFTPSLGSQGNAYHSSPLVEGWLISVNVYVNGNIQRGQNYIQLSLGSMIYTAANSNQLTAPNAMPIMLIADALAGFQSISWPTCQPRQNTDGQGALTTYTPANPAAGADFTFTFSASYRVQVLSVYYQLVTSSGVANRASALTLATGSTNWTQSVASAVQAASITGTYNFMPGTGSAYSVAPSATTLVQVAPLAALIQSGQEGSKVFSTTTNIQAGDQIQNIAIRCLYWNESD